jgi:DNA-binding MarR family transcriptional regulator
MKTEEKIIETIIEFSRFFREIMMNSCKSHSLTMLQIHVLHMMKDKQEVKMKDIADKLMIAMPTASGLVDKLSDQKLINRKADKDDRRNVLISLTAKGEDFLKLGLKVRNETMHKLISNLSTTEKENFLNILIKLKLSYEK